jgi:protein arginine kinase
VIDSSLFKLPEWFLAEGPESDVVLSTRVRLARNVDELPFAASMNAHSRASMEKDVRQLLDAQDERYTRIDMHRLSDDQRRMLVESNTISPSDGERGDTLYLSEDRELHVHVNAEDHLRIVGLGPGVSLSRLYERVEALERVFDEELVFAVSLRMGYFTADMQDVGTGMRASALLHLPALAETGGLSDVVQAIDGAEVKYEIFQSNERVSLGDLLLLSNARAIGRSEREIVESLEAAISQFVTYEREARNLLLDTQEADLRLQVDEALSHVRRSEEIAGEEAIRLVSRLRLAAVLGMIERSQLSQITSLFFLSQPSLIGHGRRDDRGHGRRVRRGSTVEERRALLLQQQLESLR